MRFVPLNNYRLFLIIQEDLPTSAMSKYVHFLEMVYKKPDAPYSA